MVGGEAFLMSSRLESETVKRFKMAKGQDARARAGSTRKQEKLTENSLTDDSVTDMDRKTPTYTESGMDVLLRMDKKLSFKLCLCPDPNSPEFHKRLMRMFMKLLEITGHGIPWILLSTIFVFKYEGETQEFSFNLLIALLFDLIVVGTSKYVSQRQRPVYNRSDMVATVGVDKYSFPSGHATRGVMVTVLLWSFVENYYLKFLILQWAVILALSRIMMGRHHIGDVFFGAILGFWEAWVIEHYIWTDTEMLRPLIGIVSS